MVLFHFSRGARRPVICTSTASAGPPGSSRPRGGQAAAACGPRVPSPQHAEGDRGGRAAPAEPTLIAPRPCPGGLCVYGPGSVSLCNPQGFRFGGARTPFSRAVGGEAGTRRRAVAAPAAARDGACQRSAARPPGWRLCGGAAGAREPLSAPPRPPSPRPLSAARARAHSHRARRRRNTNTRAGRPRGEPDSETLLATQ